MVFKVKKTSNGKKKFDSPMPVAAKGLVQNHMICKQTIGTGMAPTIFWSARAEGAVFCGTKHRCLDPDGPPACRD
jgi:hypothetical protein